MEGTAATKSAGFEVLGEMCACIEFKICKKQLKKLILRVKSTEMDNLYSFIGRKNKIYVITPLSVDAYQIVGFDLAFGKIRERALNCSIQ